MKWIEVIEAWQKEVMKTLEKSESIIFRLHMSEPWKTSVNILDLWCILN